MTESRRDMLHTQWVIERLFWACIRWFLMCASACLVGLIFYWSGLYLWDALARALNF